MPSSNMDYAHLDVSVHVTTTGIQGSRRITNLTHKGILDTLLTKQIEVVNCVGSTERHQIPPEHLR